jgi:hypothetical protein
MQKSDQESSEVKAPCEQRLAADRIDRRLDDDDDDENNL